MLNPRRKFPISTCTPRASVPRPVAEAGARVAAALRPSQEDGCVGRTHPRSGGGSEWCGQIRRRPPTSAARPAVTATTASTSESVSVRSSSRRRQPVGQADLVVRERPATVDVEERHRAQQRSGRGAGWPRRRRRPVATSSTTTARSRSTAGWRDGVRDPGVGQAPGGEARDRDFGHDDPLGPQLERLDDGRMDLPDPADDRAIRVDPRRATRVQVGIVGRGGRTTGAAKPSPARPARRCPWRRRGRTAGRLVPGRRLGRPGEREPEAPPLVGLARLVRGPIALADLEDRDVVAAVAAGWSRPPRAGCRRGSGEGPSAGSTAGW